MRILLLLLSLAVLGFSACDEDSFSNTVELDIPDHEPLPVFTMDARAGDTALFFRVALSRGILDPVDPTPRTAELEINRDGDDLLNADVFLSSSEGSDNRFRLPEVLPGEVATYRVTMRMPGFDAVTAVQEMPSVPVISNFVYTRDGARDLEGFEVDEIEFDLQDNPNTEDYYGFRIIAPVTFLDNCVEDSTRIEGFACDTVDTGFTNTFFIDSPDPTLRQGFNFGLVMTDGSFSGPSQKIRLTTDFFRGSSQPIFEVFHLSEDAYRYALSRLAYENARDNPFAEPVNVHTNIEGGLGHFLLSNRIRIPIEE